MFDNTNIHGEYFFEIQFQNMFLNYKVKRKKYKNIITNNGRKFILNGLYDDNYKFYSIANGTGTNKPSKTDVTLENKVFENTGIHYNRIDNTLELKTETQGYNIKNTTEIGVYYLSDDGTQLVSRNIHNPLELPDNSYVTIKYYYVLSTAESIPEWTLVTGKTATYVTELDYIPQFIVETDTKNGYHNLDEITDIDSLVASYYYDSTENLLYVHCSDSQSPSTHEILINY